MEKQTGLADRARFEAFSRQWRDAALKEAGKWCADENAKHLLADAVLADLRRKYADSDPPSALGFFLRAQVCTVYSQTGQNLRKLENYIDEHAFPEPPEAPPEAERPPQAAPAAEAPPAEQPTPAPAQEAAPAPAPAQAPAAAPAAPEASAPANSAPEKPAPPAPVPPAPVPDTFLDPTRTTLWTPDEERNEHVVQEIALPDDEESERSVAISFLNTILFLLTVGAFSFCFYETGFLQYLLQ